MRRSFLLLRVATQELLSQDVRKFYNNGGPGGGEDRNFTLSQYSRACGEAIPLINHHFGVGPCTLTAEEEQDQKAVAKELHRLEVAQADCLLDFLGGVPPYGVALDAGCGRGGTAFKLWQRCGCKVQGVTLSEDQCTYARDIASGAKIEDVQFHVHDMLQLNKLFPKGFFSAVYANETDMYILDLAKLYKHLYAHMASNAPIALATWCCNAAYGPENEYERAIDENYGTKMHTDTEFVEALGAAQFEEVVVRDLTEQALPYWLLRNKWELKSGVEEPFIQGYTTGRLKYLMIRARKP